MSIRVATCDGFIMGCLVSRLFSVWGAEKKLHTKRKKSDLGMRLVFQIDCRGLSHSFLCITKHNEYFAFLVSVHTQVKTTSLAPFFLVMRYAQVQQSR